MNLSEMYQEMGIDQDVYAYGQKITEDLKERFAAIDETAEYNQLKVLHAMQKNRVSDIHFAATSGYGYNDLGRDTLEASRGILDDIAVMHSRNNLDKNDNAALVVCLSFPNKRQGYFQVIKDIHQVLDLKIQTISLGALLLLVWNGASVNFLSHEFYVDFDNLSIRGITEFRLNRRVTLSEGKLGILEPEK